MSFLVKYVPAQDILDRAIEKALEPDETRMVRRGKFFLSDYEMQRYGSFRRPIFQYWGHNVIVADQVFDRDGYWCYAIHNDFHLIPATTDPMEWPEYERTDTGWSRKAVMIKSVKPSIDLLKFDWSKALGVQK